MTLFGPAQKLTRFVGQPYKYLAQLELPPSIAAKLETLTDIADALGIDELSFSAYPGAIERLETEELSLARSLLRAHGAEDELTRHLLTILHEKELIKKWSQALQSQSDTDHDVALLRRQKTALTAKAKEYEKELDTIMADMPEAPPVSITELAALRKKLKEQEHILKQKRAKVEAFQGLPPNIELARHALAEARDKQMELINIRERLLGKMVKGVN
ncbi:hypothetical protein ONZ51_g10396 [Trametes cubensis]|uniref:Uncharacterized protein n=1 Tax=Trametes cubensis TaxID=1111947 RepID=A0AAD7TKR6_9APHY|nr:hypothetical protein ONZ51_g10396 [Trametes cubensis]